MVRRNLFWPLAVLLALTAAVLWPRLRVPVAAQADLVQPTQTPVKLVALTFDDGPKGLRTQRLLDGLDRRGVKATFFLIGKQIEGSEELIRRMDQSGHQIGIHTFDHVQLTGLSAGQVEAQLGKTRAALKAVLGRDDFMLRPPYGAVDQTVVDHAGSAIILWSVDPEDWHRRDVAREVDHIVSAAKDGDIILMHDIFTESVDAALEVVDRLHAEGYAFVTVEELLYARGIQPRPGQVYRCCPPR